MEAVTYDERAGVLARYRSLRRRCACVGFDPIWPRISARNPEELEAATVVALSQPAATQTVTCDFGPWIIWWRSELILLRRICTAAAIANSKVTYMRQRTRSFAAIWPRRAPCVTAGCLVGPR